MPPRRRADKIAVLLLLVAGILYHYFLLRTFSHWWFEDDPSLFAMAKAVANPLRFFFDRAVIAHFGSALAPMQTLSMWCDDAIAYRSVRLAQIHHILSSEIALVLLFLVLRNFGLKPLAAAGLGISWLLLPAVVVVNNFLSARHYVEGCVWTFGAMIVAQKMKPRETMRAVLLFALLLAAAFSKEIFAITVPLGIALLLWQRRLRFVALSLLAVPPFYLLCRLLTIGHSAYFGAPFLGASEYMQFLIRTPYLVAGNIGGYVLLALTLALLAVSRWRGKISTHALLGIAVCGLSALAVVYPVAFQLRREWLEHGTWYRAAFFFATGFVLTLGFALAKMRSAVWQNAILLAVLLIAAVGGLTTARKWQTAMNRHRYEGRYYLAHPDRLLYSELPAFWFLPGVDLMYAVPLSHHVTAVQRHLPPAMENYKTIWRYRDGKFVQDQALFAELLAAHQ